MEKCLSKCPISVFSSFGLLNAVSFQYFGTTTETNNPCINLYEVNDKEFTFLVKNECLCIKMGPTWKG